MSILSHINNINAIVTIWQDDISYTINQDHPHYKQVIQLIENDDDAVFDLINTPVVENTSQESINVEYQSVSYNGQTITNKYLVDIIERLDGIENPAVRKFINRLFNNPDINSAQQLMEFLNHNHLPITDHGTFLAYKGVSSEYIDIHSGKLNYSPGNVVEMERKDVVLNQYQACGAGLHVGTYEYANSYANHTKKDKVIICEVDPIDVVSVPIDCNHQKLRACRLVSLGDCTGTLDNKTIYKSSGQTIEWKDYISNVREYIKGEISLNQDRLVHPDDNDDSPADDEDDWDEDDTNQY